MNKSYLLLALFCLALNACSQKNACIQKDLKFEASTSKDTIYLGETLSVRLSLQGVQSNIFKNPKSQNSFFEDHQEGNDFRTFIDVKPDSLGANVIGPFKIALLGKEYQSNKLLIQVISQPAENIHIEMPNKGVVGEKIQIKISGFSDRGYSFHLKDNDIFKINSQSHSTNFINGKYTKEASYTVTLKKKGVFELNKDLFNSLPDHIKLTPMQLEVN